MSLLYKEDWEETKERMRAWWAHEDFGRCAMSVVATKDNPPDTPEPPRPGTPREQWFDLDYVSQRNTYDLSRNFYGGEAVPIWHPGYPGHTGIQCPLGSPLKLDWNTGWSEPILTDPNTIGVDSIRFDESESNYQFTLKVLKRSVEESRGKCIPSIGALGGCGDTLASLRGTEQLLFDCIERPEEVRAAEELLMDMWCDFYDSLYEIVHEASEGSACWFGLWSPEKHYIPHNDFSYNISPEMFRELFLPSIHKQTEFLDHSVYHVDGVEAFVHVDALCEVPNLQALQILPGAGKPSPLHYMDVLKKVQDAGKNLHISIPPEELRTALENLSSRGLFLAMWAENETEARELLKQAEKWSE